MSDTIIVRNLEEEFRKSRRFHQIKTAASQEGSGGVNYSYLAPGLFREPPTVDAPYSRRVGVVSGIGSRSVESDNLTNVEKRAIMKSASHILYTDPEMYGPLFDPINWYLPYTYKVLNRWIRYWDRFDPWIGNAIDMHSEIPLSRFTLTGVEDEAIQREYEDIVDQLELYQRLLEITREYWLLGEAFPFAHWNEGWLAYDQLSLLNPDYVHVRSSPLVHGNMIQFELEPDDATLSLVKSSDPADLEVRELLDPVVIQAVETGTNIPLSSFNVSHIARKASPYDLRGTSIVLRCLKDMLYMDKVREAQMAIADRLIVPLQIFKLGDPKGEWLPSQAQLDEFAELLASGRDDPNFAIVSHYGLQVEYVGATGKIIPTTPEFDFVRDRILAALFTNRAMMDGSGPTYANASVAFEVLQLRYMSLRGLLEMWVKQKIFKPIAQARGYYTKSSKSRTKQLVVPDIKWLEKIRLLDDVQMKRFLLQLRMRMEVPLSTICDIFDLDYETLKKDLANELGTVADPVWRQAMSKEIALSASAPTPQPSFAMPGIAPGMGMPFGEMFPGATGPSAREVAPEGGVSPGGPELPGLQPEMIGPGAGVEASKKPSNSEELANLIAYREALERKHVEAVKKIEEEVKSNGKMYRRVFGVARNDNKHGVKRMGDSFYVVDRG